jgi:hypothetical protein
MVLKNTLNGDKIPICRVEDLEITLVSPDLPVKVRLPTKSEHQWRSLSEIRAAEVQCMQLSLALLARHESEMYVTIEAEKNTTNYLQTTYNQEERKNKSYQSSDVRIKHLEECEKVFGNPTKSKSITDAGDRYSYQPKERLSKKTINPSKDPQKRNSSQYYESSSASKEEPIKITNYSSHGASDKYYRTTDTRATYNERIEQTDSYNRSHRPVGKLNLMPSSSGNSKTKTNMN